MSSVPDPIVEVRECPKCGHVCDASVPECPRCGVILAKAAQAEHRREQAAEATVEPDQETSAGRFAAADSLAVRQQVERWEAFTGFETPNQYSVIDGFGNVVFLVEEESGEWAQTLSRLFLKGARPFTLHILTDRGEPVLRVNRPFRFYFHELTVSDAAGRELGTVSRRFSVLNKVYTVRTASGESFEVFGPLWRPWTFKIRNHGTECGVITKKWSGALKEFFTDADSFGVQFPPGSDARLKAVFLGAVFLIDFVHFEENHRD